MSSQPSTLFTENDSITLSMFEILESKREAKTIQQPVLCRQNCNVIERDTMSHPYWFQNQISYINPESLSLDDGTKATRKQAFDILQLQKQLLIQSFDREAAFQT